MNCSFLISIAVYVSIHTFSLSIFPLYRFFLVTSILIWGCVVVVTKIPMSKLSVNSRTCSISSSRSTSTVPQYSSFSNRPVPVDVQVVAALGGSCDVPRGTGARRCQHACMCVEHRAIDSASRPRASQKVTCHKVDVMVRCFGYNNDIPLTHNKNSVLSLYWQNNVHAIDTGARRCQNACMCMPPNPTIVVSHKVPSFRIAFRALQTVTCHKVDAMARCVGYNINVPPA